MLRSFVNFFKRKYLMSVYKNVWISALLFAAAFMVSGCADKQPSANQDTSNSGDTTNVAVDDHSGWWCSEHGIPEAQCSMCSAAAAKEFKENDDWCVEHNRAESQCFICDPTRAEKYAKLYEAKYGKQPPAIPE
jgi:hypothetical protein